MKIAGHSIRWWTASILMFVIIGLLGWDIFAFSTGIGNTISDVMTAWLTQGQARTMPAMLTGFVFGGLFIHFCGWTMPKPDWKWLRREEEP